MPHSVRHPLFPLQCAAVLQRRLLALRLLGCCAFAPLLLPPAALAGKLQQGSFAVPYQCGLAPVNVPMLQTGDLAAGSTLGLIEQNSDTDYAISSITVIAPNGVNPSGLSADVVIEEQSGNPLVVAKRGQFNKHGGKPEKNQGKQLGLKKKTPVTTLRVITVEPTFRAGNYQLVATLSCSQSL